MMTMAMNPPLRSPEWTPDKPSREKLGLGDSCRCQNRRILGRGSRSMRLRLMVTGNKGHNVYPGSGPLDGGKTLLPA